MAIRPPVRRILPLRVRGASTSFVAFDHPRPSYPKHVVIVSTTGVRDFLALEPTALVEVFDLAAGLDPPGGGELLTNLGRYQDVRLLHFHLVHRADAPMRAVRPVTEALDHIYVDAAARLGADGACRIVFRRGGAVSQGGVVGQAGVASQGSADEREWSAAVLP